MSSWRALGEELEAWQTGRRTATLWWRDDDATEITPALERLLDLAARRGAPLSLAVIPAGTGAGLAGRLAREGAAVTVLQHGYAHANHAPPDQKPVELGPERPNVAICEELRRGQAMLSELFGKQVAPVLVPPWNRIAAELVPELAGLGFRGLSRHTARAALKPARGLVACNTHLDVMHWKPERKFVGEEGALDVLIAHLRARRLGFGVGPGSDGTLVDPEEPSGLLTHHLVMDEPAWDFVAKLIDVLTPHPAARWIAADEAFHLSTDAVTGT